MARGWSAIPAVLALLAQTSVAWATGGSFDPFLASPGHLPSQGREAAPGPALGGPLTPGERRWLADGLRAPRSLGGRRSSWLDGAPAEVAGGGVFGTVDGFLLDQDGAVVAIYVRRLPDGPDFPIPRPAAAVTGEGVSARLVIAMTARQVLALAPAPASSRSRG